MTSRGAQDLTMSTLVGPEDFTEVRCVAFDIDDTLCAEAEAGNKARRLVAIRQDSGAWGDGRTKGQRILSADAIPSLQMRFGLMPRRARHVILCQRIAAALEYLQ